MTKSSVSLRERGREGSTRTAHEADLEAGALDEARGERVEAAGRLVRAGHGEDPAEGRGRGFPPADDAGGLVGGEVRAARGHAGTVSWPEQEASSCLLETLGGGDGWGGRAEGRECQGLRCGVTDLHYGHGLNRPTTPANRTGD